MKATPTADERCGSRTGYKRHARRGEYACQSCRDAHAARGRAYTARCKARRAPVFVQVGGRWQAAERKALLWALSQAGAL